MGSLKFSKEELTTTLNAAIAKGALEVVRKLGESGYLSKEKVAELRKGISERFGKDIIEAEEIHRRLRFDPYKNLKFPW